MATLQARLEALAGAVRDKLNLMTPRLIPTGGAIGQVLAKVSATNYAASWADPLTGWTYLRVTTDQSVSATAAADITGLAFALTASKDYEIEAKLLIQVALATTGPRLGVALPTGMTDYGINIIEPLTTTSESLLYVASNQASAMNANTGYPATGASYLNTVVGLLRAGTAPTGNFRLQIASEIAASAVTVRAGSFLRYRQIN